MVDIKWKFIIEFGDISEFYFELSKINKDIAVTATNFPTSMYGRIRYIVYGRMSIDESDLMYLRLKFNLTDILN